MVCYRLSRPHGTPDWIVLRPVGPGTRRWKGLTSTGVTEPYAVLTPVQHNRLVLPRNSIRGQHSYAMGATRTHTCILLQT